MNNFGLYKNQTLKELSFRYFAVNRISETIF